MLGRVEGMANWEKEKKQKLEAKRAQLESEHNNIVHRAKSAVRTGTRGASFLFCLLCLFCAQCQRSRRPVYEFAELEGSGWSDRTALCPGRASAGQRARRNVPTSSRLGEHAPV